MAEQIHQVDAFVGMRLREFRKRRRISQSVLAEALGVTFQQVQKYENGANRVSASRLFEAARKLGVPVAAFFEGLPDQAQAEPDPAPQALGRAALEIGRLFEGLTKRQQSVVRELAETMMEGAETRGGGGTAP